MGKKVTRKVTNEISSDVAVLQTELVWFKGHGGTLQSYIEEYGSDDEAGRKARQLFNSDLQSLIGNYLRLKTRDRQGEYTALLSEAYDAIQAAERSRKER